MYYDLHILYMQIGRILTVKLKVGNFLAVLLFIDSPSSRSVEIDPSAMILNF